MDINTSSQFDPSSIPGYTPTQAAPPSSGTGSSSPDSSIEQSELAALAQLILAGIPVLSPPEVNGNAPDSTSSAGSVTSLDMMVEAKKADIISKMWDSYLDNIRQIAEQMKKDDLKRQTDNANQAGPMSSTQYLTYLMSSSSTKRDDEVNASSGVAAQFTNTYNQWLVQPVAAGDSTAVAAAGGYASSAFVSGSVASTPDLVRLAVGTDSTAPLGVTLSSGPVADALNAAGPTSGLPGDYQAAAAMVAALLNGGAVAKATQNTIAAPGAPQPNYDLNFALDYAKNIMAIVTKNIGESSDPNNKNQNNMMRLMLSAMALNMVYRAAYGGMAGVDMASLLNGGSTKDIPNKDVRDTVDQLVALVNSYIPPSKRDVIIARLSEYVDSKDPVDSMLETTGLFTSALASNANVNAKQVSQSSV
jgi:hypothetical protein